MTDQGKAMSRRARREAEARRAAPDQPTTPIPTTGSRDPFTNPDGTPMTRKQRRELERRERPIETWTAEEEMIATGQVPAMTPDMLAAQELVERRRAEDRSRQQAESEAVAEAAVSRAPSLFVSPGREDDAPAEESAQAEALAPEPVADESEPVAEAPAPETEPEAEPESTPEPEPESTPEPEPEPAATESAPQPAEEPFDPERFMTVVAEPVADFAAEFDPVVDDDAEEYGASAQRLEDRSTEEAVSQADTPGESALDPIPDEYRHLFPPGSLQAQRLQNRVDRGEPLTPAAGTEAPRPLAAEDPAEEIRRLTAQAMEGITRAQQAHRTEADEPAEVLDPAQVYAHFEAERGPVPPVAEIVDEPEPEPGPEPEAESQGESTPPRPSLFGAVERPSIFGRVVEPPTPADTVSEDKEGHEGHEGHEDHEGHEGHEDHEGHEGHEAHEPLGALGAEEASVTRYAPTVEPGITPGSLPQRRQAASEDASPPEPAPEPAPEPQVSREPVPSTPAGGQGIVPAGLRPAAAASSLWESHPLAQAQPREVAEYQPSEDIPIPDFTKIMHGYASTTSSAGTAPEGQVGDGPSSTEIPVSTGAVDAARRALPEESEEGAHHFAWAHLAVIGAVAFLLGVLVWHLTGNAG